MNINAIRAKLDSLNNNGQDREKTDYSKLFWKPEIGKQTVRIVPSALNPDYPFTELKFHYGIGKYPMIALSNFGKQDPIEEFVKELRKTSDKDNWSLSGKISPKTRIFAPVVVRGEEDKGTRLWQFGKQVYEELLALAIDDEIGDYTDIVGGRDLTVETVGPESTGTPYNKSSVRVRLKTSPLSEDATQVETWTNEQPNPKEGLFKIYSFDEMKSALEKWLAPEDTESDNVSENAFPTKSEPAKPSNFSLDTSNVKKNKADQFDALFPEDSTTPKDDLPF